MNEYVVIGLGLGVISIVMIAVFLLCHRKRKRRRLEHPSRKNIWTSFNFSCSILYFASVKITYLFSILLNWIVLPSHAHFHTCESIGERFATSSSINSVSMYQATFHLIIFRTKIFIVIIILSLVHYYIVDDLIIGMTDWADESTNVLRRKWNLTNLNARYNC